MIKLKQIIFYDDLSGVEATWVDEIEVISQIPDPDFVAPIIENPEIPGEHIPDIPVTAPMIDKVDVVGVVVKCHSYAACQMEMLRSDALILGTSLDQFMEGISAVEAAYTPAPIEPIPVPQIITIRQAKLVLLANGLLDDVDSAVAQADRATQIEWEYATEIHRSWPTLIALQNALGLSKDQVDQLFIAGALL